MSITLTRDGTTLTLNPDLYWSDEHSWFPVEQTVERSVTGALIVSVATRDAGRPVTLEAHDDSSGWITAADLTQLKAWAAISGCEMSLTIRETTRTVMFRHQDGQPIEADPIAHYSDIASGDFYRVTLRFMEV